MANKHGGTLMEETREVKLREWSESEMSVHSSGLLAEAIALLRDAKCPNCDGSGAIPRQTSSRQLITRDMAMDAGCPEMEGAMYSDDEWQLEQCQWCDELHRLLRQYTANNMLSVSGEQKENDDHE